MKNIFDIVNKALDDGIKNKRNLIGVQYLTRGKHPKLCTVVDEHTTYNRTGDVVKVAYVSEHIFLNQIVRDKDVNKTTILMNEATQ
jgi:hypothetical protein